MYCQTQIVILFLFPKSQEDLVPWAAGETEAWNTGGCILGATVFLVEMKPAHLKGELNNPGPQFLPCGVLHPGSSGGAWSEASPRPTDCQTGPICSTNGSFTLPKASSHPPLGAPS